MKRLVLFFILLFVSFSWGDTYLLLVGINKYKFQNELKGAVNDMEAIKRLFLKYDKNVKIFSIYDEKATKRNIIYTLNKIKNKLKKGDKFYFFYSGHGTGYKELNFPYDIPLELEYSGAIIPYDGDTSTPKEVINTLIWGYKDLKPILIEIDKKGVLSFLFFDSCFSGFTVRNLPVEGNTRTIPLPENIEELLEEENKIPSYSYKNIIYCAASTNFETAKEMTEINRGYFSFYLEKAFKGDADFNKDGKITKKELRIFFLKNSDKIPSTPVIYPERKVESVVVYSVYKNTFKANKNSKSPKIYLENVDNSFFKEFYITNKKQNADFIVKYKDNQYTLIYGLSMVIMKSNGITPIKNYIKSFELFSIKNENPKVLQIKILKDKTPVKQLKIGETGALQLYNSSPSYLFIFSMDKQGNIFLLEPVNLEYLKKINGIEFEVFADEPVGIEFIKVFSVYDRDLSEMILDEIKRISKKDRRSESIIIDKHKLKNLIKLFQNNKNKWADVLYPFISYE